MLSPGECAPLAYVPRFACYLGALASRADGMDSHGVRQKKANEYGTPSYDDVLVISWAFYQRWPHSGLLHGPAPPKPALA
jgi:hypothetical protein